MDDQCYAVYSSSTAAYWASLAVTHIISLVLVLLPGTVTDKSGKIEISIEPKPLGPNTLTLN